MFVSKIFFFNKTILNAIDRLKSKLYLFLCCPLSVDSVKATCWSSTFAEV